MCASFAVAAFTTPGGALRDQPVRMRFLHELAIPRLDLLLACIRHEIENGIRAVRIAKTKLIADRPVFRIAVAEPGRDRSEKVIL